MKDSSTSCNIILIYNVSEPSCSAEHQQRSHDKRFTKGHSGSHSRGAHKINYTVYLRDCLMQLIQNWDSEQRWPRISSCGQNMVLKYAAIINWMIMHNQDDTFPSGWHDYSFQGNVSHVLHKCYTIACIEYLMLSMRLLPGTFICWGSSLPLVWELCLR